MPEDLLYIELWIARLEWKGSVARRPRPRGWWRETEGPKESPHAREGLGIRPGLTSSPHLFDYETTRLIFSNAAIVISIAVASRRREIEIEGMGKWDFNLLCQNIFMGRN